MKTRLHHYPLFLALTRPPMMMGVTQTFFVLNVVACMMLFMVTKAIFLALGMVCILHLMGVGCCRYDDHFFEIIIGKLPLTCRNKNIWGCNSYDPS